MTIKEIQNLRQKLLFTKYGDFLSGKNFAKYGFLSEKEVKNLLQLSFRIRNSDYLIDIILQTQKDISTNEYNEIVKRAEFICISTKNLLNYIANQNPALKLSKEELEKES